MSNKITKFELSKELLDELTGGPSISCVPVQINYILGNTRTNFLGRIGNFIYKHPIWLKNSPNASYENDGCLTLTSTVANADVISSVPYTLFPIVSSSGPYIVVAESINLSNTISGSRIRMSHRDNEFSAKVNTSYNKWETIYTACMGGKDMRNLELSATCRSVGDKVKFRNIRLYYLSPKEKDAISSASPDFKGYKFDDKFQYIDGIRHIENPTIECNQQYIPQHLVRGTYNHSNGKYEKSTASVTPLHDIYVERGENYTFSISENSDPVTVNYGFFDICGRPIENKNNLSVELDETREFSFTAEGEIFKIVLSYTGVSNISIEQSIYMYPSMVKGNVPKSFDECVNTKMVFETSLKTMEMIVKCPDSGLYEKICKFDDLNLNDVDFYYVKKYPNAKGISGDRPINMLASASTNDTNIMSCTGELCYGRSTEFETTDHSLQPFSVYISSTDGWRGINLKIPNTMSGWGDSYTPTNEEIKAFFLGWTMVNLDDKGIYNGSGRKGWMKIWNGVGEASVSATRINTVTGHETPSCPKTINDQGFMPYTMTYRLSDEVVIQKIKTSGSLFLSDNSYTRVYSGLIKDEVYKPSTNSKKINDVNNRLLSKNRVRQFRAITNQSNEIEIPVEVNLSTAQDSITTGDMSVALLNDIKSATIEYDLPISDTIYYNIVVDMNVKLDVNTVTSENVKNISSITEEIFLTNKNVQSIKNDIGSIASDVAGSLHEVATTGDYRSLNNTPTSMRANGGDAETIGGKGPSDFIPNTASCNRNWQWSGQPGQPNWLWGGVDDPNDIKLYNPSNFSVNSSIFASQGTYIGDGRLRNTWISQNDPNNSQGKDGDIWVKY